MTTDAKTFRAFFGEAEREFRLTPKLIEELEHVCGAGIGAIFTRLTSRQFRYADILETIRLGLIGGGESTQRAASLIELYGANRPLAETLPIAVGIFTILLTGEASSDEA